MIFCILGVGYVGKAVLSAPQSSQEMFYALTRSQEKAKELLPLAKKVFLLKKEDKTLLGQILEECNGLFVFVAPQQQDSYETTYLETAKIIRNVLQKRKDPFFLLYTSSTFVYEGTQGSYLEENTILTPRNSKAKLLLETENIYQSLANESIQVAILRLGGIYGPGRELSKRAQSFSGQMLSGTGEEPTNHIHLEDIINAIYFFSTHQFGGIYNLVNDDHPSRKNLYDALSKQLQIPPPSWDGSIPSHGSGMTISNQKIKKAGFVFKHPYL